MSSLIVILAAFVCLQQQCHGQQPLASQSETSADPLSNISWSSGPQKITLGDFADINIPSGYRLTDVHGARMILATFNDAIPDDLVGIVVPVSGKSMTILEYSPVGYVMNPNLTQINTKPVLNQILNQIGKQAQSSVTSLNWQSQPAYDAKSHLLEWSLKLETPSTKILNQSAVMFGRRGVLQVTVVQRVSHTDASSLKLLVNSVVFKHGESYADYKKGDRIAQIGLADLISGQTRPQTAEASSGGFGSVVAWFYCGLALCLLTGSVIVVRRRNKTKRQQAQPAVSAPASKKQIAVKTTSSNPQSVAVKNSGLNSRPQPVFNHSHHRPFRRKHRKRIFDFTKFYTKVMRELSPYAYGPPIPSNIKSHSHPQTDGRGHDDLNGHADVQSNGHAAPHSTSANQTTKSELDELIAIQKSLIEHQKCLLEEQDRLIAEKRSLIEEQTAFLKTQSSLVAVPPQQDYPLKIAQ